MAGHLDVRHENAGDALAIWFDCGFVDNPRDEEGARAVQTDEAPADRIGRTPYPPGEVITDHDRFAAARIARVEVTPAHERYTHELEVAAWRSVGVCGHVRRVLAAGQSIVRMHDKVKKRISVLLRHDRYHPGHRR